MRTTQLLHACTVSALIVGVAGAAPFVDGEVGIFDSYSSNLAVQVANVIDEQIAPSADVAAAVNNTNVGGVSGFQGSLIFPTPDGPPSNVVTGVELCLPLDELGALSGGSLKMLAYAGGGGAFLSNQGAGADLPAQTGNVGNGTMIDWTTYPGDQFVTINLTPTSSNNAVLDGSRQSNAGEMTDYVLLDTNTLATTFGNNQTEYDAMWAYVSDNGTAGDGSDDLLYVLLAGNLEENFNKYHMFFDVGAGGQNVITEFNSTTDFEVLPVGFLGMIFDVGFSADYYLNYGGNTGTTCMNAANIVSPAVAGTGNFNCVTPPALPMIALNSTQMISAARDNSNTLGVAGTMSGNGTSDPIIVPNPGDVTTGMEFKINLSAMGWTGGDIDLAAMITGFFWDFGSNQVVGGLPNPNNMDMLDGAVGNLGSPLGDVDFNNFAGNQFVTVTVPGSLPVLNISVDGTRDAGYGTALWVNDSPMSTGQGTGFGDNTDATGDAPNGSEIDAFYARVGQDAANGNAPTLFVFAAGNLHDSNKLMVFADTTAGGQNTIRNDNANIGSGGFNSGVSGLTFDTGFEPDYVVAYEVGVSSNGTPEPEDDFPFHFVNAAQLLTDGGGGGGTLGGGDAGTPIDGTIDSVRGFGDNDDPSTETANGSELDTIYLENDSGLQRLGIMIGGNIATDFTKLDMFFDTQPGGQNTLVFDDPANGASYVGNPDLDNFALNRMGGPIFDDMMNVQNEGLTFDSDFAADHYIFVTLNRNSTNMSTEIFGGNARLRKIGDAPGLPDDTIDGDRYWGMNLVGNSGSGSWTGGELGGSETAQVDVNNSNIAGVSGAAVPYEGMFTSNPATVITGIEISVDYADVGLDDMNGDGVANDPWDGVTPIRICLFINGSNHDLMSNQVLGPICSDDLGEPRDVDFSDDVRFPMKQYVQFPAPMSPIHITDCDEPPAPCPGDPSGDREVNIVDLNLVLGNFGNSGSPGIPGDANGDGMVNIVDLNLVLGNFGTVCP